MKNASLCTAEKIPIAFDIKLMKPGCVLIQAGLGGSAKAAQRFDNHLWLTAPTPDLKLYQCTEDELDRLVKKTQAFHAIQAKSQFCWACGIKLYVNKPSTQKVINGQLRTLHRGCAKESFWGS